MVAKASSADPRADYERRVCELWRAMAPGDPDRRKFLAWASQMYPRRRIRWHLWVAMRHYARDVHGLNPPAAGPVPTIDTRRGSRNRRRLQ